VSLLCCCIAIKVARIWPLIFPCVLPVSELSGEDASVSSPHANVAFPAVEDGALDADDVAVDGSSADMSDERIWLAVLMASMAGIMAGSEKKFSDARILPARISKPETCRFAGFSNPAKNRLNKFLMRQFRPRENTDARKFVPVYLPVNFGSRFSRNALMASL
jgi:hypothetical protein